jgi:hypothetical protein
MNWTVPVGVPELLLTVAVNCTGALTGVVAALAVNVVVVVAFTTTCVIAGDTLALL